VAEAKYDFRNLGAYLEKVGSHAIRRSPLFARSGGLPVTCFREGLARWANRRFYYGWVVLGVAALGIFVSGPGQSHTFSVFVGPIGRDLDLSGTAIASAYGVATLVAAFCLPLMGRLLDRKGPRSMLVLVTLLLGLAGIAFAAAAGMFWLALGFAALRFLGQGSLMLCCANLVARWFDRRRGVALSLMALGFAASMAVHPPASQWLIELLGWREAWLILGLVTWALMLPPLLLLVFDEPATLGLLPDGGPALGGDERAPAPAAPAAVNAVELTLDQALRTPAFYIVTAGLFSLSMLVTALHFFQVSIFAAHGIDARTAAQVFAVSAITMVLTMPLIGGMLDRYRTERMFAGGLVVMVASLVSATLVEGLWTALAYAVVFGLNNAVTMIYFAFMYPRYFGLRHLGSIQGTGQMIAVVGASLGPLPLGLAQDVFGSYNPMLLGLTLIPACLAVVALFLRDPKPAETR
jgi:MFS family permease